VCPSEERHRSTATLRWRGWVEPTSKVRPAGHSRCCLALEEACRWPSAAAPNEN
jgi:hypothetical protein